MERNLVNKKGFIDAALQIQIENETKKWRAILKRILFCIKYLAEENLALRGHREGLKEDVKNPGHLLSLMKLLAVFDSVMEEHINYLENHPGATSYLSPTIQNEFLHLMADSVRNSLLGKIKKAKYYGLIFDCTPDSAHHEQMSEVIRYVDINFTDKTVSIKESFLNFIRINKKDAESLSECILQQLKKDKMDVQDCRAQCYDNAAVMAGQKNGVFQRIKEKNSLATFVNCDNHSLNLVGVHAAKQDAVMITFFGTLDAIYVFFSRSTSRWEKLEKIIPTSLKSESETRWSSRIEAIKPIQSHLDKILSTIQHMSVDLDESCETRSAATLLLGRLLTYEFFTLLGFWNKILTRIDRIQKRLQDTKINFHEAALDLKALRNFFQGEREELVSEAIEKGNDLCKEWDVPFEKRQRRIRRMAGEKERDVGLTAKEEINRIMKNALDRLDQEMDQRFVSLNDIDSKFGFLLNTEELFYGKNSFTSSSHVKNKCHNLANFYNTDVDGGELYEEIIDCHMLLASRTDLKITNPLDLLKFIVQYGDESVFPNLRIATQILLTIATSIASCERSFSKLKLILSYLRTTMGQQRLCDLSLLSIEKEELKIFDFEHIINQFASVKARKVKF
nr:uncharacterized protein LOC122273728 [Parasteatoda tepidariorum]